MIPLSDGIPARRFPIVNVALIVANFAVWILYELPHLNSSVYHAAFYPCTVAGTCHRPLSWTVSWLTSIFMHGSWDHWFLYQLVEANFGVLSASANGGGVAFFAHVGGFIFGVLVAKLIANRVDRREPLAAAA